MKYRPEIDGLRSIAVIPVILFHGGFTLFSGGFVGVDVFFVISGYLITSIILKGLEDGSFSLMDFYARRCRRILPALFFIILVTLPFAWVWMLPLQFKDHAQSMVAVTVFASNILFWIESGYFAPAAELKPLLHTWSLAVEEQYYVFFPLILMLFWLRSRVVSISLLALIFIASLLAAEWGWRNAPSANFYLLPFRAWELMMGSLTAIWLLRRGADARPNNALSAIGLAMILASIFVYDGETPFPSLYALLPVAGTAMVIAFAGTGTAVASLLSRKAFVGIGLISYSAYLWHQPLFAFARLADSAEPPHWLMATLAVASLGLAVLTWRFVERPFRKPRAGAGRTLIAAGTASVAIGISGAMLSTVEWQRNFFIRTLPDENQPLLARIEQVRSEHAFSLDRPDQCLFVLEDITPDLRDQFDKCAAEHGPAIAILGDSHSRDVFNAVAPLLDRRFAIRIPQKDCRPHILGSVCEIGHVADVIDTFGDDIKHLFYVQAGFWLFLDKNGEELDRLLFGAGRDIENPQLDLAAIDRTLPILQGINADVPVTWIGPRLEPYMFWDEMLGQSCIGVQDHLHLRPGHREAFEALNAHLAQAVPAAGLGFISEMKAVNFDPATEIYSCDQLYWSDSDHWSKAGEDLFGPRLADALNAVLATD
ncbi:acyltransferase [Octadecabacter sp. CECT 8868]|uniref:acyltransferase family protein n=1 Tax=Octadecabacter algicola TaxID=2909342 RepID=UPI001F2146EE|nr:acyltransferase family protein [Octadecabacter algicola]MCF2906684.1 acyltransferase [Octadecabacter algicola]